MTRTFKFAAALAFFLALGITLSGCYVDMGPSVSGSFDRSLDVSSPLQLELSNVSGDVTISGAADGKVHVHGDVRVSGFGDRQQRLNDILANPPLELKGSTLRIGKDMTRLRHVSISYTVEVPRDTSVNSSSVSGSQSVRDLRGPIELETVSGSLSAQNVGRDTRLSSTSGSVNVDNCSDDVRATSVSGSVTVTGAKGDVVAHSTSGSVTVHNPGGRVDADSSSGTVEIRGANADVKAHSTSGGVVIGGNPSGNSYWDLKTVSGSVNISVPSDANFHLSSSALSGQIRTQIPIIIEEQGKHSLRARMGSGTGRVEVHTISGSIELDGAS